jgi:omega-amidase
MQDLKVVLVQADQRWEQKSANHAHFSELLSTLNEQVDLIILPEMFDTGFSMNTDLAEDWNGNTSKSFVQQLAKQYNSAVYTSMMCKESGRYYNRGVFVLPDGNTHQYDKRKCFGLAGEDKVFTAGNAESIAELKGWNIQLQICYDLRFPEICRNRIVDSGEPAYDLLLYVANWPEKRSEHWKILLQARAIENQCYVLGVNRIGEDGKGLRYTGDSCAVDPLGKVEFCHPSQETLKVVTLSKSALWEIRQSLPFLKDRKC